MSAQVAVQVCKPQGMQATWKGSFKQKLGSCITSVRWQLGSLWEKCFLLARVDFEGMGLLRRKFTQLGWST